MKKKLLAYVCLIACIFGLTACGSGEELNAYEQDRVDNAGEVASGVISIFSQSLCQGMPYAVREEDINENTKYLFETNEEIEYLCEQYFGMLADGNAVVTGVQSFDSGLKTIGGIKEIGGAEARVSGNQIIVEVKITGEKQDAVAEIIFSNDVFMRLESVALNPVSSMWQLMGKAALNTLIGMWTVFAVLILISFIISCFRLIAKVQDAAAKRKEAKAAGKNAGADNAVAQIEAREAADETDDLELVAVITAAIAASQGSASADGFVVRSVIRR